MAASKGKRTDAAASNVASSATVREAVAEKAKAAKLARPAKAAKAQVQSTAAQPLNSASANHGAQPALAKAALGGKLPTVIYIHGVGNQKLEHELVDAWDNALFEQHMGSRTRFAYWVDRQTHPLADAEGRGAGVMAGNTDLPGAFLPTTVRKSVGKSSAPYSAPHAAQMLSDLQRSRATTAGGVQALGLRDHWAGWLASLNADVVNLDGKEAKRAQYLQPLIDDLSAGDGPYIVVSHSLGSVIAYEVLSDAKKLLKDAKVALWVTLGSPLSYDSFRESVNLHLGRPENAALARPACVTQWLNVADPADLLVGLGGALAKDVEAKSVKDGSFIEVFERGINQQLSAHFALGYLCSEVVRQHVYQAVGLAFRSRLGGGAVTAGAQRVFERVARATTKNAIEPRQKLMIELADIDASIPATEGKPAQTQHNRVRDLLAAVAKQAGTAPADMQFDCTLNYVVAHLTRHELMLLRGATVSGGLGDKPAQRLPLKRVWAVGKKSTLINESISTVQVASAQISYRAYGDGVRWAVLDTGVEQRHPHFKAHNTIERFINCSAASGPVQDGAGSTGFDDDGHGTHVAAIIAGELADVKMPGGKPNMTLTGMAARTKLWCYRVLDQGRGDDVWIIKALDHIWSTNQRAGKLVVHGVNLSLGGAYDVESYNCGYTPLCDTLRRLWSQGVLVVIAAGNEGYAQLKAADDNAVAANLDLSINDPANLEDAIVVGSVHKAKPHSYGVSYFSSRGPTADGRAKPDIVAPGEKIMSASAAAPLSDYKSNAFEKLYVELSGTSMAAPHVSGLLAAFLSARPEFIGQPDKVKALLLATATDLKRDKYFQGAGMPNLMKMLLAV